MRTQSSQGIKNEIVKKNLNEGVKGQIEGPE